MSKMFVHYSKSVADFKSAVNENGVSLEQFYTNHIVFIKGGDNGTGEAVYTHGQYYANVKAALEAEISRAGAAEKANADAIDAIEADYLKSADKTELSNAITAETQRATGIEGGLETRLAAVEADYLKAEDKTKLQNNINAKVAQSDYDAKIAALEAKDTELEGFWAWEEL